MPPRTGAPRVMLIGLDLGDGPLLRRWAESGELPHLQRLMRQGTAAELGTTAEWLHVSAWPTLYTGAPVGHHGVYYTFQPAPGLQGYRRFAPDQYGVPTMWRLLGDAGVRCTVFDAPYTHPERGEHVTQIFDWGTWAHYFKPASNPPELLRRLTRACGAYPLGLEAHDLGLAAQDAQGMQPRLLRSVRAKTDAILWLMRERPWDCFVAVYGETHPGAHYCWDPARNADQQRLRELYRELDTGIGRIASALPDDTTMLIVTGDRIAPNHSGWHLLPDLLRRTGMLAEPAPDAPTAAGGADAPPPRAGFDPVRALRDLLPKDFRKSLARRLPTALRDRLARRVDTAAIDWSRTRAYLLPTDLEGCVRINLAGREPHGIVQPGAEYDAVCDELCAALTELVNPATGARAVREVIRADDRFAGPRRDYLPDLVVLWSDEAPITALDSPRVGHCAAPSPDGRPGTHAAPGFLIASGAAAAGASLDGAHVRDIAPTILSLYGVERPNYMDGATLLQPLTSRIA
ncbi:MAG TPA: alkaline phosphatase family protein [Gemmatimonadaceae bacterium]|nr:alkaline phosphatase family protein [Gemmatimonadaceae bacterium]